MTESEPIAGRHLLFDIESNGLMPGVSKVHCIGVADVHSGEVFSFPPDNIEAGLAMLYEADCLSGHHIIGYDFKVLKKLYGWGPRPGCRVIDTRVLARVKHPDIKKQDFEDPKFIELGGKPGGHRLKDWGIRLGEHKAEYDGGWEEYTLEMLSYMMQDLKTNVRLLQHLKPAEYPRAPLDLEQRVEEVCYQIETAGWLFDSKKAANLYTLLCGKRDELEKRLVEKFGSWQEISKQFEAKRDNATRGIKKGDIVTNWKTVTFNPGSRVHIEKKLREAGWEPEKFTASGRAQLSDEVLEELDVPEAKDLIEYLLIQKRLGQIADGDNGWLRLVEADGRIHAKYNPLGTVTGRAVHYKPNISQVPAVRAMYGKECRELFKVPKGWKLVDADMSGLELRCLAHYLAYFDGGAYADIVVNGDVHTVNQKAMGVSTRDLAKTTCYATLYGAGDFKVGRIVGGGSDDGRRIKHNWKQNVKGLGSLMNSVAVACDKGYLKALDGRSIPIRSPHAALNTLLQSAGAILCKVWLADAFEQLSSKYKHGYDGDFVMVGWIHDALDVACREDIAEEVGSIIVSTARAAGHPFAFRCALDSSFHVGKDWSEVH